MRRLSLNDILQNIDNEDCFEAVADDYSFSIKIEKYTHYVCAAVHDGHQFRKELWENCMHTSYERWYEEDPCTKEMVQSHPIVIAGRDSRFEYDLNRDPENAIYEDAWGRQLWKSPLSELCKNESLSKHNSFYLVVHALIKKLESLHPSCIVYDMHSYNWKRWKREVPAWNLGTSNVDNQRFGQEIELWRKSLSEMVLANGLNSTSKINDTFFGNGYFLKFITKNFKNTLVLATEIAKIYCDELTYVTFPEVVDSIEKELRRRIPEHAASFAENQKNRNSI